MRVIVVLGPGGVGKTTISAAIAVKLSKNAKTALITVDPAKRLKSALSIDIDEIKEVRKNLWATQVDKFKEFSDFAQKYGISEISKTKLFKIAADMLPSEEYASFLKIIEIYNMGFDYIVVDTPPSLKFISFVSAPQKILSLFETDAIRYFLEIAGRAGKRFSGPISIAGRILSADFVVEFANFLANLKSIFSQMKEVSEKARKILKGENTVFIGVASPYDRKIEELLEVIEEAEKLDINIKQIIINRYLDFSDDGIPINSPDGVVNLHQELVKFSSKTREQVKTLQLKGFKVFLVEELFKDIVSIPVLEEFSEKIEFV
jgi:anion-transporting  ArsA/GET3 family ATPase